MTTQHIPAWKRLGLKLKYANENNLRTTSTAFDGGNDESKEYETAAKVINGSGDQSSQLRRFHSAHETSLTKLNGGGKETLPSTKEGSHLKRKKSVSFTPDTKVEDGDSAQTIQYWIPESAQTAEKTHVVSNILPSSDSTEKVRRQKRPKHERDLSQRPRKANAALDYLHHFQNSRSSWKFNKNHETWILKHALSLESLPREYDLALASYLKGLKSVESRRRLVEQSREVLKAENDSLVDDVESRAHFHRILDTDHVSKSNRKAALEWLGNVERSMLILWSFDERIQSRPMDSQQSSQDQLRKKKKKARTAYINIDLSSSSDSDSDSDSDDDTSNSDSNTQTDPKLRRNGLSEESIAIGKGASYDGSSDTSSSGSSSTESR